jgi:hypothetical protein
VDLGRELVEPGHPRVPDASEATAIRDALARALDALGSDERVVVTLRVHVGLTVLVIAEMPGIPEGAVKSRLHNAMGRLRVVLEEWHGPAPGSSPAAVRTSVSPSGSQTVSGRTTNPSAAAASRRRASKATKAVSDSRTRIAEARWIASAARRR